MEYAHLLSFWRTNRTATPLRPPERNVDSQSAVVDSGEMTGSTASENAEEDDGPFFDLEFSLSNDDLMNDDNGGEGVDVIGLEDDDKEDDGDQKGEEFDLLVRESPEHSKDSIPALLLKSSSKLRVLMLALRRSRSTASAVLETSEDADDVGGTASDQHQCRFFIKRVDVIPIVAFFTRDAGSRKSIGSSAGDLETESSNGRLSKEALVRYFEKIKPLYGRASKRQQDSKPLFSSGELKGDSTPEMKHLRTVLSLPARIGPAAGVRRLGKSKSEMTEERTTEAMAPPMRRQDDSLLQVQDGIESAIAHCKRSFNEDRFPR